MEKEKMMEELKRNILRKVDYREAIPEEINEIIERSLNGILEVYEYYKCDNNTIQEYMEGAKGEINVAIERIGEERKNLEFEEFQQIIHRMENEIEEKEDRSEERDKQDISEVEFGDDRNSMRIMELIEDVLKDIQNKQNYILDARGYSYDRIEQISDDVRSYITNVKMREEENVRYALDRDRNELVSQIIQEYESFVEWEKSEEQNKQEEQQEPEKTKNERENFAEELNAGISLEKQRDFVEKIINEEKENPENEWLMEDLPGDVIR